jgi:hypothetical protein
MSDSYQTPLQRRAQAEDARTRIELRLFYAQEGWLKDLPQCQHQSGPLTICGNYALERKHGQWRCSEHLDAPVAFEPPEALRLAPKKLKDREPILHVKQKFCYTASARFWRTRRKTEPVAA